MVGLRPCTNLSTDVVSKLDHGALDSLALSRGGTGDKDVLVAGGVGGGTHPSEVQRVECGNVG